MNSAETAKTQYGGNAHRTLMPLSRSWYNDCNAILPELSRLHNCRQIARPASASFVVAPAEMAAVVMGKVFIAGGRRLRKITSTPVA
jgi:hypothetical protein